MMMNLVMAKEIFISTQKGEDGEVHHVKARPGLTKNFKINA